MTRRDVLAAVVALSLIYGWSSLATGQVTRNPWDSITDWIRCIVKPHTCED